MSGTPRLQQAAVHPQIQNTAAIRWTDGESWGITGPPWGSTGTTGWLTTGVGWGKENLHRELTTCTGLCPADVTRSRLWYTIGDIPHNNEFSIRGSVSPEFYYCALLLLCICGSPERYVSDEPRVKEAPDCHDIYLSLWDSESVTASITLAGSTAQCKILQN
jgi:hypothetical protein